MNEKLYYSDGTPIIINSFLTQEELDTLNEDLFVANNHNAVGNYDEALSMATEILEKLCVHDNEYEQNLDSSDGINKAPINNIIDVLAFNYHVLGTHARYLGQFDKTEEYFTKGLNLSEMTGNIISQARAYGNFGLLRADQYKMAEELEYYEKALELDTEVNNKRGIAMWLNNIGLLHGKLGEYSKALDLFMTALNYDIEIGDERGKSSRLMNIAIVHMYNENLDQSLEYLLESLQIEERLNNLRPIAKIYNNIATVKGLQNKHNEAIEFLLKSLAIDEKLNYKQGTSIVMGNIGDMYIFLQDYETALEYLLKSLAIETELQNKRGIGLRMASIGVCYAKRLAYDDDEILAEEYLLKGLAISEEVGNKQHLITCYEQLALLYESQNRLAESIKHYKLHFEIEKEVRSTEVKKKTAQIEFILKNAEKEKELAVERARAEEKEFMIDELTRANMSLSQTIERVELLNEQLQLANNAKNNVIGVVAHDLKNPLASIVLNADSLRRFSSKISVQESERMLEGITKTARRMNSIIANLLDIHALESGRMNLVLEPVYIAHTLKNVLDENIARAETKSIKIINDLMSDLPAVRADSIAAEQVLDNLISNAIKYSPLGTTVLIYSVVKENMVQIYVKDEGPGINDEEKNKLFGKFQKLSAQPTGGETSTGLGLSVAKMLTEEMKGSLWCDNSASVGTAFVFELQIAAIN